MQLPRIYRGRHARPSSWLTRWTPGVAAALALTLVSGVVWAVRPSDPPVVEIDTVEALTAVGHLSTAIADGTSTTISVEEFSGIFRDLREAGGTNLSLPFDIEIDADPTDRVVGERMTVTARASGGGPAGVYDYIVTRGVRGTAQAWSAGAEVYRVWPDGSVPLVNRANVAYGVQYVATLTTTGFHTDAIGTPFVYSPDGTTAAWFTPDTVRIADPETYPDAKVLDADAATTEEVESFEGLPTIDGITLAEGDVLLVREQEDTTENGLWVVSEGGWSRWEPPVAMLTVGVPSVSEDPAGEPLHGGSIVAVADGDTYGGTTWILATDTSGDVDLGSDPIFFSEFNPTDGCLDATGAPQDVNQVRVWFKQDRTYGDREFTIHGTLGSLDEDTYSVPTPGNGTTEYRTFASEDDLKEMEGSATLDISADVAEVEDISTWWVTESRWSEGGATCYPDGRAAAYTAASVAWNQPEIQQIRLTNFDRPQNEVQRFDLQDFGPAEDEIQTLRLSGVGGNVNEVQQVALGDFRVPVNETQQVAIAGFDTRYNEQQTVYLNGFDATGTNEQQLVAWSGFTYNGVSETQRLYVTNWDTPGTNESQKVHLTGFDAPGATEKQRIEFPTVLRAAADEQQRIEFNPTALTGSTSTVEVKQITLNGFDGASPASAAIAIDSFDPATPKRQRISASGMDAGVNEVQSVSITWDANADAFKVTYGATVSTLFVRKGGCGGQSASCRTYSAADVKAVIESVLPAGGTVDITNFSSSAPFGFRVTYTGAVARTDVPQISLSDFAASGTANAYSTSTITGGQIDERFTLTLTPAGGSAVSTTVTYSTWSNASDRSTIAAWIDFNTNASGASFALGDSGSAAAPVYDITLPASLAPNFPTIAVSSCLGWNGNCSVSGPTTTQNYAAGDSFTLTVNNGGPVASRVFGHGSDGGATYKATATAIDDWLESVAPSAVFPPALGGNRFDVSFGPAGAGFVGALTSGTFTIKYLSLPYPASAPAGALTTIAPAGGNATVSSVNSTAAEQFTLLLPKPFGTGTASTFTHGLNATAADIDTWFESELSAAGFSGGANVTVTGTDFTGATTSGSYTVTFGGDLIVYNNASPPVAQGSYDITDVSIAGVGVMTANVSTTTQGSRGYFRLAYTPPGEPIRYGATFFYSASSSKKTYNAARSLGYWYNPSGNQPTNKSARQALGVELKSAVRDLLIAAEVPGAMGADLTVHAATTSACSTPPNSNLILLDTNVGFCMTWTGFSVPGVVTAVSHISGLAKVDGGESYNEFQGRAPDLFGFSFGGSSTSLVEYTEGVFSNTTTSQTYLKALIQSISGFEGTVTVSDVSNVAGNVGLTLTFGGAYGFVDVSPVEGRASICDPRPCTPVEPKPLVAPYPALFTTTTNPTGGVPSPSDWIQLKFGGNLSGKIFRGLYTAADIQAAIYATAGFTGSVFVCPLSTDTCSANVDPTISSDGSADGFTVTFGGAYSFTDVAALSVGDYLDALSASPVADQTPNLCVAPVVPLAPAEASPSPTPDPSASPTPDASASPTPDPSASPTPAPSASPAPDAGASEVEPCYVENDAVPSALADSFTLTYEGATTAPISYPLSLTPDTPPADATLEGLIASALQALPGFAAVGGRAAGTVDVKRQLALESGGTRIFNITFGGGLAARPINPITISSVYSPPEKANRVCLGSDLNDSICRVVEQVAGVDSDLFKLGFDVNGNGTIVTSEQSVDIRGGVNDTAAGIKAAIEGITGFQGSVDVCLARDAACTNAGVIGPSGTAPWNVYSGGFLVTFTGRYAASDQPLLQVVSPVITTCTVSPCVYIDTVVNFAGPDSFQLAFDNDGDGTITDSEKSTQRVTYANYTYASVKSAVESIPAFTGTATVTNNPGCSAKTLMPCGFIVEFSGTGYDYRNLGAKQLKVIDPLNTSVPTAVCGATLAAPATNTCTVTATRRGGADRFRVSWTYDGDGSPTYSDSIIFGQDGSNCTSLTACASSPVNTALNAMEKNGVTFDLAYYSRTSLRFQLSGALAEQDVTPVASYAGIVTAPGGDASCTECSYNIGGSALTLIPSQFEAGRPERSFTLQLAGGTATAAITNRATSYTKANLESVIGTALGDTVTVAGISGNSPTAAATGSGFKITFGVDTLSPNRYQDLDLLTVPTSSQVTPVVTQATRGRPVSGFAITFDPTPDTPGGEVSSARVDGEAGSGSFSAKATKDAIAAAVDAAVGPTAQCVTVDVGSLASGIQDVTLTFEGADCRFRDIPAVTLATGARELTIASFPSPSDPAVQNNGHVRSRFYLQYEPGGDGDGTLGAPTIQADPPIHVKGKDCGSCSGITTTFSKPNLEAVVNGLLSPTTSTTTARLDSKDWSFFDVTWTAPGFQNVGPLGIYEKADMGPATWTEVYRGQPAAYFALGYGAEESASVSFPESYEAVVPSERNAIQNSVLAAVTSVVDPTWDAATTPAPAIVTYHQWDFSYEQGENLAPIRREVVQIRFSGDFTDQPMDLLDLRDVGPSGLVMLGDVGPQVIFNAGVDDSTIVRTSAGDAGDADVQSDLTNEGDATDSAELLVDLAVPDLSVVVSPLVVEQGQPFTVSIEGNDIATLEESGGTVDLSWVATPRAHAPSVGSAGPAFSDDETVSLTAGDDITPTDYTVPIPCSNEVGEYDLVATVEGVTDLSGVPYTIEFPFLLEVVPSTELEVRQFIKDDLTGGDLALNGGFTVTKPKGATKSVSAPGTFRSETFLDITDACLGQRPATVAFDKGRNEVQRVSLTGFGEAGDSFTLGFGGATTAPITPDSYDNVSVEAAIDAIMPAGSWVDVDAFDATGFTVTFLGTRGTTDVGALVLTPTGATGQVSTVVPGVTRSSTLTSTGRTYDVVLTAPTGFMFQKSGSVTISGTTTKVDTYSKISKGLAGSSTLSALTGSILKADKSFELLSNSSKTLSLRLDALTSQTPNLRLYVMTRLTWVGSTAVPAACTPFAFVQFGGWDGWNGGAAGASVLRYAEQETHTQNLHHAPGSPVITTAATLPGGSVGGSYSTQLTGAFGGAGYTFSGTGLPAWLTLTSGGLLSAVTIPAMGTYTFTVTIASSNATCGTTTKTFSLTVS